MKNDNTYVDLIARYLSGNLEGQDKKELFDWVEAATANKAFFDEMVSLWAVSGEYREEPFNANLSDAWTQVEQGLEHSERGKVTSAKIIRMSNRHTWWRVAAIALLFLTAGLWWMLSEEAPQMIVIQTDAKEQLEWQLPDGSTVWLNENTTISYDSVFSDRLVSLEGEAFFDVEKRDGMFFEILSGEAKTTVLGTRFNVRAYSEENHIEVTVEEGQVILANQVSKDNAVNLEAGDSGILNKSAKEVIKAEAPISNANAWITKQLIFEDITIKAAIPSLERYFDVEIKAENEAVLNCHLRIVFPEVPEIETVFTIIQEVTGDNVIFEEQNSGYLLKGEGCNDVANE